MTREIRIIARRWGHLIFDEDHATSGRDLGDAEGQVRAYLETACLWGERKVGRSTEKGHFSSPGGRYVPVPSGSLEGPATDRHVRIYLTITRPQIP